MGHGSCENVIYKGVVLGAATVVGGIRTGRAWRRCSDIHDFTGGIYALLVATLGIQHHCMSALQGAL